MNDENSSHYGSGSYVLHAEFSGHPHSLIAIYHSHYFLLKLTLIFTLLHCRIDVEIGG